MDAPYTRKERNADHKRAEALIEASKQRKALAARLDPEEPARTQVPAMPVPVAEHPEPTPFERHSGYYNSSLDPISPDFSRQSWGGE